MVSTNRRPHHPRLAVFSRHEHFHAIPHRHHVQHRRTVIPRGGWSLSKGKIQQGGGNIAFVNDPFPNSPAPSSTSNSTGPVLQVKYPAGGFGSQSSGMQLYSLWNTSDALNTMLLSYEVAFDSSFDFVKGGKLPGLRGGPDPDGCSGGSAANGTNCFSSRLMWRTDGAGEGASCFLHV